MTLAPDCALAVALAGWCHERRAILAWNKRATEERTKASQMADQAGILAPADPMVLAIRASIAHLAGAYAAAESLAVRAVAMDPTCAWGWDRLGWVHETTNRPHEAMRFFARRSIPAPYLDGAASLDGVGTAHFCAGRYKEAAPVLRTATLFGRAVPVCMESWRLATCSLETSQPRGPNWRYCASSARYFGRHVRRSLILVAFDSFRNALANSLTEIGMPA